MTQGLPRHCDRRLRVTAEVKIAAALDAVEALGADRRLTEAAGLLGDAAELVSDFVDDELAETRQTTRGHR